MNQSFTVPPKFNNKDQESSFDPEGRNKYGKHSSLLEEEKEFKNAIKDIAQKAIKLKSQFDRVRCCEWIRKLCSLQPNSFENVKLRSDYIQYLRIIVRSGFLHGIFTKNPPAEDLVSLPEALGKRLADNMPKLPKSGPVAPYACHKSKDGRAYMSIKKIPGEGLMCYMAVSPEGGI